MTTTNVPNHPELPWLCEACSKPVREYEAVFRVHVFKPLRPNYRTARCPSCAEKEGEKS